MAILGNLRRILPLRREPFSASGLLEPRVGEHLLRGLGLDKLIEKALVKLHLKPEKEFYTSGSWWTNRTRYFECVESAMSRRFVEAVASLLKDKYADWKVQFVMYRGDDLTTHGEMLGSVVIYRDWLLVDDRVREFVGRDAARQHREDRS